MPEKRNKKKYRKRSRIGTYSGMKLVERGYQDDPQEFNLDTDVKDFEDILKEMPTFEDWLLEGEQERFLHDTDDYLDDFDEESDWWD